MINALLHLLSSSDFLRRLFDSLQLLFHTSQQLNHKIIMLSCVSFFVAMEIGQWSTVYESTPTTNSCWDAVNVSRQH
eukprot:scaffold90982_cov65-Cyclotella_meneghiniana.AAC.1